MVLLFIIIISSIIQLHIQLTMMIMILIIIIILIVCVYLDREQPDIKIWLIIPPPHPPLINDLRRAVFYDVSAVLLEGLLLRGEIS